MNATLNSAPATVGVGLPVQALPTSWPVEDSRSVAAEWGDGLLDAEGDTKRLSRQTPDGDLLKCRPNLFTADLIAPRQT